MRIGFGQDSHAFEKEQSNRPLILAGVVFPGHIALAGNSDADVVMHAVTNAVSGITGVNILGKIADKMCLEDGVTDSRAYLEEALKYLDRYTISNISISIECKTPKISPRIEEMRISLAGILGITVDRVGITATTGEGLTAFGRGEGIQTFATMLVEEK